MKELVMQSIWTLTQAIAGALAQPGADADAVAKVAGVQLEIVSENLSFTRYKNRVPLRLENEVVVGFLDVRQPKTSGRPPFVVISDISGLCVTSKEIERHVAALTLPEPPAHPVPDARIEQEGNLGGYRIGLSFKWSNPDCLYSIVPLLNKGGGE